MKQGQILVRRTICLMRSNRMFVNTCVYFAMKCIGLFGVVWAQSFWQFETASAGRQNRQNHSQGFRNISKCFCTKSISFYYFCHIVPWRGWPDLWSFYQFRWPPTSAPAPAPLGHRHFGLIGSRLINQPCQPPLATASAFSCLIPNSGATYMMYVFLTFYPTTNNRTNNNNNNPYIVFIKVIILQS